MNEKKSLLFLQVSNIFPGASAEEKQGAAARYMYEKRFHGSGNEGLLHDQSLLTAVSQEIPRAMSTPPIKLHNVAASNR